VRLLTGRQKREKEFHETYASTFDLDLKIDFTCVDGPRNGTERRPWNAYWAIVEEVLKRYEALSPSPRLLDFGCGPGYFSILFARMGYLVDGFDISENSVTFARKLAQKHGYDEMTNFVVGVAEDLSYGDESFDTVCGIDILHHVDITRSVQECHRVLKPGGVAFFKEFLDAPMFDRVRDTRLVRGIAPKSPSLENYSTEDERKLNREDIEAITTVFPVSEITYFRLFSRVYRLGQIGFLFRPIERLFTKDARVDKLDRWIIDRLPIVNRLCGEGMFVLRKPE
jgi:ubiquinone/menaquinone biosynthesis C-methylase UbiE